MPDRGVKVITEVYKRDLKVKISGGRPEVKSCRTVRGQIVEWSKDSRRRFRLALRNTLDLWGYEIGLSYGQNYPTDGNVVKGHLNQFMIEFSRKYPGAPLVWRIGFQQERGKRGLGYAPHFHIATDRWISRIWLAQTWARIAGDNDPDMLKASTHVRKVRGGERFVVYMLGYLQKTDECVVPDGFINVGQFWGMKRGLLEKEVITKEVSNTRSALRDLRGVKRWCKAEMRFSYKWRSRSDAGFTAQGGRRLYDFLSEYERARVFGKGKEQIDGERFQNACDLVESVREVFGDFKVHMATGLLSGAIKYIGDGSSKERKGST